MSLKVACKKTTEKEEKLQKKVMNDRLEHVSGFDVKTLHICRNMNRHT